MVNYLWQIIDGLSISLTLTIVSLALAIIFSLLFTMILALKTIFLKSFVKIYIQFFTGTPLLVQIFLIYYGPGQFPSIQKYTCIWNILSQPWLCALIALTLNSAAYTTLLFYGSVQAIPISQWQSCSALGMSEAQSMSILLPFAIKRSISSYSNEVILVFKSTSLVYTITLMDIMGQSQRLYGHTYDIMVFVAAGIVYLSINTLLTLLMRWVERRIIVFEK